MQADKYIRDSRKPKNVAEGMLYDQMASEGWTLTKRGWPDFFCVKDGKFCVVEVKPKSTHSLKQNQRSIMAYLAELGVDCYKWTPDGGFEKL